MSGNICITDIFLSLSRNHECTLFACSGTCTHIRVYSEWSSVTNTCMQRYGTELSRLIQFLSISQTTLLGIRIVVLLWKHGLRVSLYYELRWDSLVSWHSKIFARVGRCSIRRCKFKFAAMAKHESASIALQTEEYVTNDR